MKQLLSILTCAAFLGCQNGQLTPQGSAILNAARPIAQAAIIAAASSKGVPPNDTAAALDAINSIWGAYQQAQAGQPVAQGAVSPVIGQAIASNVPQGASTAQTTALLQAAAQLLTKK